MKKISYRFVIFGLVLSLACVSCQKKADTATNDAKPQEAKAPGTYEYEQAMALIKQFRVNLADCKSAEKAQGLYDEFRENLKKYVFCEPGWEVEGFAGGENSEYHLAGHFTEEQTENLQTALDSLDEVFTSIQVVN